MAKQSNAALNIPVRHLHRVSCKAAIYSSDGSNVLLIHYIAQSNKKYGLPGGHLEENEMPEAALRRELIEEIGTDRFEQLVRRDFWVQPEGKVVLGFTAQAASLNLPAPPNPQTELPKWVSVDEAPRLLTGSYGDFVVKYRPERS